MHPNIKLNITNYMLDYLSSSYLLHAIITGKKFTNSPILIMIMLHAFIAKKFFLFKFGKGVYFADVSSKSANYCYPTRTKNVGFVLLCEVCNQYELFSK